MHWVALEEEDVEPAVSEGNSFVSVVDYRALLVKPGQADLKDGAHTLQREHLQGDVSLELAINIDCECGMMGEGEAGAIWKVH